MNAVIGIRVGLTMGGLYASIMACAPAAQYAATTAATVVDRIQADPPPLRSVQETRTAMVILLDSIAAAWNRGDLDGFVADYAPGNATTFVTSTKVLRGPEAIRQAYAPLFAPEGTRDSLSFESVEVDVVATDALYVIAYYRLMHGDSTTARGPASLVMRWLDGRWRITHGQSTIHDSARSHAVRNEVTSPIQHLDLSARPRSLAAAA